MDEIISIVNDQILPHWPFLMIALIFTVIGQFTSKSVFTRERAYRKSSGPALKFWERQWFWWWGRETLALHPLVSGLLVGLVWQNPEGADPAWKSVATATYFAGAGVVSLFAWAALKGILKKKGIDLELPGVGETIPPSPISSEKPAKAEKPAEDEINEDHGNA